MRWRLCIEVIAAAVFPSVVGCGPEAKEPVVELPTCGSDGPVRLLEHAADSAAWAEQWGDRLIVHTSPVDSFDAVEGWGDEREAWSVGLCGDSPIRIASGISVHPVGELLVACADALNNNDPILVIDPTGADAPRVLFENARCELARTEHGWLAFDDVRGELWRHLDPGRSDVVAEVLATGVWQFAGLCPIYRSECDWETQTPGDAAYAINERNELIRIELETGAVATVEYGAAWAWLAPSGSLLWWRELPRDPDGAPDAAAPVHLRDLEAGTDVVVYEGEPPGQRQWPYGLVRLGDAADHSLLDLRDGTLHELPPGVRFIGTRPGEYAPVLLWDQADYDELGTSYVWDEARNGTIELPSYRSCSPREWGPDGFDVIEPVDCSTDEGDLWSYPYDGGDPVRIGHGIIGGTFLHYQGRAVWSNESVQLGEAPVEFGDLFVSTEGGDERIRLDERARLLPWPWKDLGGDVVYTVHDGERSGVWRTATR